MELFNKYRPSTFDEVMGNESSIKALKSELEHGHHVFLFTGIGGSGKTTLARIMAKEVGAEGVNLHEINSSSNTGIDTVREIEEQLRYAPLEGNVCYILDEMHMQSANAQNALLKILEECPDYCYFALCTTNPEKLIEPLKTRCSKISVKPLSDDVMKTLLRDIATKEGVKCCPDVYNKIIEKSKGSARDAIKYLGSVLYLESNEERLSYLDENSFGEDEDAIEICRLLIKGASFDSVVKEMNKLKDKIASAPESLRKLILSYSYSVLIKGYNEKAEAMIQAFGQADTYRNGKEAIMIGLLDYYSMINQ